MMRTRNILLMMVALGAVALGATSCSTALNLARSGAAAYADDLYGVHDTEALREAERLLAEQEAAEREAQEKRIAAMIAAANAEADIDSILGDLEVVESPAGVVVAGGDSSAVSSYNSIYVDDYASAYARRLQGFTSLTYRMPSSYWDYRYGDAYFLTLAYDPAFYTVMIMGDEVWVEPRYITNMFGSWNNPYYYGYHYGYNPYYYGYWDFYWGWNSPYWGYDPFYYHHHHHWYGPHYGHPHHPPHNPPAGGGHRQPNVSHRPSYGTASLGSSTARPSYREQFGGVRDDLRGDTQIAGGTSTTSRGGATAGSSARPSISTGRVTGGVGSSRAEITKPTSKTELSGTLSGTTIKPNTARPTRGSGVSGVSNSSSRSSRSAVTTRSSGSSSRSSGVSSSSSSRSRSSSSSRSYSSGSSRRSSSSSSSYSSGSSSRSSSSSSSYSSGSSSRSSYSSGGSSRSSSSGGSSNSSSRSSRR